MQNTHPNYRYLVLAHISQVRMMMREGRHVTDCRRIIKEAQRDLAKFRSLRRI